MHNLACFAGFPALWAKIAYVCLTNLVSQGLPKLTTHLSKQACKCVATFTSLINKLVLFYKKG